MLSHAGGSRHDYDGGGHDEADAGGDAVFGRLVGLEPWVRTPYWRWDDEEAARYVGSAERVDPSGAAD